MNIVLPVAGKSSRFPNVRPKWLLTNPNGNFMLVDSVVSMNLTGIESIYVIHLKEHEESFQFKKGLVENFKKYGLDSLVRFVELDNQTCNQVETVRLGLKSIGRDIPFLVKDCDNSFRMSDFPVDKNFVSYYKLENFKGSDVSSKSYLQLDNMGVVSNIVEKRVISDKFCCGAYGFQSSDSFLAHSNIDSENAFISDVIFNMILNGKTFVGVECQDYEDWGTMEAWRKYKSSFKTLFVDIDGTVVKNSSAYLRPYIGESEPLQKNVDYLKKLIETQRVELIFTTSRPQEWEEATKKQLQDLGLKYKHLIMGLQSSKRILINDFSDTNPYKSCEAVNIPRDSDNLKQYLTHE